MNNRHILASPNWYNGAICDISLDGIFAFGGKNTVFLLDLTGPDCCQYFGQLCGHKDRVSSVQFCKTSSYSRCCVSTSEDMFVIVWDVDAKESISKHDKHLVSFLHGQWSNSWMGTALRLFSITFAVFTHVELLLGIYPCCWDS